jgi:hypothetical protein
LAEDVVKRKAFLTVLTYGGIAVYSMAFWWAAVALVLWIVR